MLYNAGMFIRPIHIKKNGKRHAYWALVESHRGQRGPRQRTIAYLGQLNESGRLGVKQAATGQRYQHQLFDDEFLREGARRYIIGTPKGMLRRFERDLIKQDNWRKVYEGLEVKSCPSPDGQETFILCRSEDRRGSRCRWPSKAGVGEGGGMAGLGCSERRLLSVTYQYYRLERRRVVEGVHAVDGC